MSDHRRLIVLLYAFLFTLCLVHALEDIDRAKSMLLQKESDLDTLVGQVQKNHDVLQKNCASANCGEAKCTRLTCFQYQGTSKSAAYGCHHVSNNSYCQVDDNLCHFRNFDFGQSFVRLVADDVGTYQSICAQKSLDDHFGRMSDKTYFFQVYYGAVDGSFRMFPGSDEVDCAGVYDPRIRPWYRESIHAKKSIVVLINTGSTMTDKIDTENFNLLRTVQEVLGESFPRTLSEKDTVSFMTFNDIRIRLLNEQPIVVKQDVSGDSNATVEQFKTELLKADSEISPLNPSESNATNAINKAIEKLSVVDNQYFKVVLMFTAGSDGIPPNITLDTSARLFIFDLVTGTDQNGASCTEDKAFFQQLKYSDFKKNPLFALRPYYSWLGNVHSKIMNKTVDYSEEYSDFNRIDDSTFTLSRPVFALDGNQLLGVVGVDIFKTETTNDYKFSREILTDAVNGRYNRSTSSSENFNASQMANVPSVCYQPYKNCTGITPLCRPEESKKEDKEISCCGECKKEKKLNTIAIIVGSVGSVGALLLLVGGLLWRRHRKKKKIEKKGEDAVRDVTAFRDKTSREVAPEDHSPSNSSSIHAEAPQHG